MKYLVFVAVAVVLVSVRVPGQVPRAVSAESFAIRMDGERATSLQDDDQPCEPERVVPETNQNPTIHEATKAGDLQRVRDLLAQDPTLRGSVDREGLTPIFWAVEKGQKDIVELLLSKGSNVNEKDTESFTPLTQLSLGAKSPWPNSSCRRALQLMRLVLVDKRRSSLPLQLIFQRA